MHNGCSHIRQKLKLNKIWSLLNFEQILKNQNFNFFQIGEFLTDFKKKIFLNRKLSPLERRTPELSFFIWIRGGIYIYRMNRNRKSILSWINPPEGNWVIRNYSYPWFWRLVGKNGQTACWQLERTTKTRPIHTVSSVNSSCDVLR